MGAIGEVDVRVLGAGDGAFALVEAGGFDLVEAGLVVLLGGGVHVFPLSVLGLFKSIAGGWVDWNVSAWPGVLAFCVAFRSYGGAADGA